MTEPKPTYQAKEKTIFRVSKNAENPFVMMDKRPIENDALSWKAKGLLSYLLSRPDDWVVRMGDLIKRSSDGEYSTRAAVKELIEAGHLERRQERTDGAKFDTVTYDVYEVPQPHRGKPHAENPHAENLALNKIDSNKKDLTNTSANAEKVSPSVAGIGWAMMADRKVTQADIDASQQDTAQDRLSGWYEVSGITNEHVMVAEQFYKLSKIKPPKAPRGKGKAGESAHFYAWKQGIDKLLPLGKVNDVLHSMKSVWHEYNDGYKPMSPDGMAKAVYEDLNKEKDAPEVIERIGL